MEIIKTLSLIVFFSYIKCEPLQRSLLHAARQHSNRQDHPEENLRDMCVSLAIYFSLKLGWESLWGERGNTTKKEGAGPCIFLTQTLCFSASIMVAQFLQDASYEVVQTIAEELLDLVENCKSLRPHESPAECFHQLVATFLTYICNNQGLVGSDVFTNCCKMENTARLKCFLSYKKDEVGDIDTSLMPRPELTCETHMGSHMSLKLEPIRKYIREISSRHRHLCVIRIKFNDQLARAVELILLTKKQPKFDFSEIAKLTTDIKNLHETCCEGNTVACVLGRHWLMNYTCSNQAILSSKFAQCCEQPEPFRGECIINSGNDDKPNLSPLSLRRFTEAQSACKQFSDKQDDFLQEFLYEYSRGHLKLAVPVILRVFATYKHLLEKCCKLENPLECHSPGKEMFQRVVCESHDRVKTYCDLYKKLGGPNFQDRLTVLYTKKAPQLSSHELVTFTRKMAAAASRCCPLREELQSACVKDALSPAKLILGALCRRHDTKPVNAGVSHCCDSSHAFRKPCFDDLQVDGTYIPPPLSCDQVISLEDDLCQAQEEALQIEKQKLLSNLVKQKPHIAEEAFLFIGEDFLQLVEMCCHAGKREICFQEETNCSMFLITDYKDQISFHFFFSFPYSI
ncbi:Albfm1 [Phodopus roborovskii]|uniref:Albfm1 protein n=1 Tax=Phodopus roborovskii TaxID=109678 RepID=A0AAU9ZVL7_PHORO|nr:Albfm1 [Phodopus roborovskii]